MCSLVRLQFCKLSRNAVRSFSSHGTESLQHSEHSSNDLQTKDDPLKDMPVSEMRNPFERTKSQCTLCKYKVVPDYKNVKLLSQFVSPYTGRVYGRHITGLCSAQQKKVEEEIGKSQNAGFMAYYLKQVEFLKDPKLFDPEHPIRPHRF